jgi:mono/diheme cytochrome c family protein
VIKPAIAIAGTCALLVSAAQSEKPPASTPAQVEFFDAKIRPVLMDTCGECHLEDEEGGLRVDSREALVKGGENGPAVVPGDPEKSLLIHAIRRDGTGPRMPKEGPKLSDDTIAAFTEWIKQGAPWPPDKKDK